MTSTVINAFRGKDRASERERPVPMAGSTSIALNRLPTSSWDTYISSCDAVSQEQLWAFSQARWPSAQLEPIQFIERGQPVGGVLMMIMTLPLGLGQIATCKNAPVLQSETASDAPARHERMLQAITAEYADRRGMMISLSSRAMPAVANYAEKQQLALGFAPGKSLDFPDRYFVDLRLDDETRLKHFDQKWRYNLRKSFKQKLVFEVGQIDQLDDFDTLYQAMSDRKRFPDDSPYTSIRSFFSECQPGFAPRLFFVRKDGELVAGAIIFTLGNRAHYMYGATNEQALSLRAGYLLHWEIIRWLRTNTSARWYDLGGTDGFQGLHQFKKGMVGRAGFIVPTPPIMNFASRFRANLTGKLAYSAHGTLQSMRHRVRRWCHDLAAPDQDNGR